MRPSGKNVNVEAPVTCVPHVSVALQFVRTFAIVGPAMSILRSPVPVTPVSTLVRTPAGKNETPMSRSSTQLGSAGAYSTCVSDWLFGPIAQLYGNLNPSDENRIS